MPPSFAPVHLALSFFVVCDGCAGGTLELESRKRQGARREAMSEGWRVDGHGAWYCPPCAEQADRDADMEWTVWTDCRGGRTVPFVKGTVRGDGAIGGAMNNAAGASTNSDVPVVLTMDEQEEWLRFVLSAVLLFDVDEDGDWERARRRWPAFREEAERPHSGDCTRESHACSRCHWEAMTDLARGAMSAARSDAAGPR